MSKQLFTRFAALGLLITASVLCVIGYMNTATRDQLLTSATYYFIFTLSFVWGVWFCFYVSEQGFSAGDFFKAHRSGIILCLVIIGSILVSVGTGYRVLSDETNLVSVSQSMSVDKTIYNTTMAKRYYDQMFPVSQELPTRPVLYSFLTSLVHNVTGYRYQNAFYTNAAIAFLVLLSLYLFLVGRHGAYLALSVPVLIASQPLFSLCATSAGFEMTNLFFLVLSLILANAYVEQQKSTTLIFMWYSLIMLAHVRYENLIYIAIIFSTFAALRVISWRELWQHIHHWTLGAFLLVPRYWQSLYADGKYENGDKDLLNLARVPGKIYGFLQGLFGFDPKYPYAALVNWAVLVLVLIAVVSWVRKRKKISMLQWAPLVMALACGSVYLVIVCSHFLADPLHPAVFRLFMLPTVFLTASVMITLSLIPRYAHAIFLAAAGAMFFLYNPVAIKKELTKTLTLIRSTEEIYRYLDQLNDSRILLVTDRPGQYTVRDMGAINHHYANKHSKDLLMNLERGLFSRILVVQEVAYVTGKARDMLSSEYQLNPVYEFQYDAIARVVISDVKRAPLTVSESVKKKSK